MNIYTDIETIPAQDPEVVSEIKLQTSLKQFVERESLKAPANYKDPVKIAQWIDEALSAMKERHAEELEEAIDKTALDGTYGQIVCIGYATDEGEPASLAVDDLTPEAEEVLLRRFFGVLSSMASGTSGRRPVLIGHNLIGFDLPFIWRRAVIRGVKPPHWWPRSPKPWSEHVGDTMLMWAGDRGTIGMDRLCKALGLAGKGDISGADVWPMVKEGRLAEVAAYCRADVARTRALWQRMNFQQAA